MNSTASARPTRVSLVDLLGLERVDLEIRPLTVVVAQSPLLRYALSRILWGLAIAGPHMEAWARATLSRGAPRLASEFSDKIKRGEDALLTFRRLVSTFLDALPEALGPELRRALSATLEMDVSSLASGPNPSIEVERAGLLRIPLSSGLTPTLAYDQAILESLFIERTSPATARLSFADVDLGSGPAIGQRDVVGLAIRATSAIVMELAFPALVGGEALASFLPAERVGALRAAAGGRFDPRRLEGMPSDVRHAVKLYHGLAEARRRGAIDEKPLEPLLEELRCELLPPSERGPPSISVRVRGGPVFELPMAPPGVCSPLLAALLLASPPQHIPVKLAIVEEPEAHIEPGVLAVFLGVVAALVQKYGRYVILVTQSEAVAGSMEALRKESETLNVVARRE
ncbi:MAG: hypothetical protein QXU97_04510 [Fervidicoccaceae archaeon]